MASCSAEHLTIKTVAKPRVSDSTRNQFKAGQLCLTQQKCSERATLNASASKASTAREGPGLRQSSQARYVSPGLWERSHAPDLWQGQVGAHPWRRVPAGWHQRQSQTRQRRLVLVVSKVFASRFGAGMARSRSTRGQERIVGRPAAGAAVEVEKEEIYNPEQ